MCRRECVDVTHLGVPKAPRDSSSAAGIGGQASCFLGHADAVRLGLLERLHGARGAGSHAHMKAPEQLSPAEGKLAVFLPGLGAVATTFIAGCLLARRGMGVPIGSLTQMGTIRLGKRTDNRVPLIKDFVLARELDDLVFGGWDLFPDNAYEAAKSAEVLESRHLDLVKDELAQIKPMTAVFYPEYVKRLHGTHVKTGANKADMVEAVRDDIRQALSVNRLRRAASRCGAARPRSTSSRARCISRSRASRRGCCARDPNISNVRSTPGPA